MQTTAKLMLYSSYIIHVMITLPSIVYYFLVPPNIVYITYWCAFAITAISNINMLLEAIIATIIWIYTRIQGRHYRLWLNDECRWSRIDKFTTHKRDVSFPHAIPLDVHIGIDRVRLPNIHIIVHGTIADYQRKHLESLYYPGTILITVAEQANKADAINNVLDNLTNDAPYTMICDATQTLEQYALFIAYNVLVNEEADVVQGRCIECNDTLISALSTIELGLLYTLQYTGGQHTRGFMHINSVNSMWRTTTLQQTRMDANMINSDSDASVRAILNGARVIYNNQVISYTNTHASLTTIFKQHAQQARGWHQLNKKHNLNILRSNISLRQKLSFVYILVFSELYNYIFIHTLPLCIVTYIKMNTLTPLLMSTLVMCLALPIELIITYLLLKRFDASNVTHIKWWHFIIYMFIAIPYAIVKTSITLITHVNFQHN